MGEVLLGILKLTASDLVLTESGVELHARTDEGLLTAALPCLELSDPVR